MALTLADIGVLFGVLGKNGRAQWSEADVTNELEKAGIKAEKREISGRGKKETITYVRDLRAFEKSFGLSGINYSVLREQPTAEEDRGKPPEELWRPPTRQELFGTP